MRRGWKFALMLLILGTLLCECAHSKKTSKRTKQLKKLSHVGRVYKAAQPKTETGQKKSGLQSVMQPSHEQVAAMQNPEGLQASETEIINHLQNYNKHYLNNEMAAETALLADNGIDDDSALKISNLAALPNGIPHGLHVANAAIKAKISNSAEHDHEPADKQQASNSPGTYDPNAYLKDANSWPEYSIHDSDYSNFHAVEMNNMNGENTDMPPMYNKPNMYDKPDESPEEGYQNMGNEGGIEYLENQKFPQEKADGAGVNDEVKEAKAEALQDEQILENHPQESFEDRPDDTKGPAGSNEEKSADSSEASGEGKAQSDEAKLEAQNNEKLRQRKPENNPTAQIKDAASPKQQNGPQPQEGQRQRQEKQEQQDQQQRQQQQQQQLQQLQQQLQQQQQEKQQEQQQAKSIPAKLAASAMAQAAASLPPKAIASLVSRLVGGGKALGARIGQGQGQIQNGVVVSSSQTPIPQDINPAKGLTPSATQRYEVTSPKAPIPQDINPEKALTPSATQRYEVTTPKAPIPQDINPTKELTPSATQRNKIMSPKNPE